MNGQFYTIQFDISHTKSNILKKLWHPFFIEQASNHYSLFKNCQTWTVSTFQKLYRIFYILQIQKKNDCFGYLCLIYTTMMSWFQRFSATRCMKVNWMGMEIISRRIWLFSANNLKSSESVSKQPTQLIIVAEIRHNYSYFTMILIPGQNLKSYCCENWEETSATLCHNFKVVVFPSHLWIKTSRKWFSPFYFLI